MIALKVNTEKAYKVLIQRGLCSSVPQHIAQLQPTGCPVIITDSNVYRLYEETLRTWQSQLGAEGRVIVLPAGERHKCIETLAEIYERLAEMGARRDDMLVAFGGGVVGDITGFAAATYLRGVRFAQVPTTLLADVDSSVGGKTAINLKAGKNLAGAFYQPDVVLIDPDFLKTLPEDEYACGMAEVIKSACIRDKDLFDRLLEREDIETVIAACCNIKAGVVAEDERDRGLRMLLNFGHTAGHALEKLTGYGSMTHGQAVAIGMDIVTAAGERAGLTQRGTRLQLKKALQLYGLSTAMPKGVTLDDIVNEMRLDKKHLAGYLNVVVLKQIGEAEVVPMTSVEARAFFKGAGEACEA